MENEGRKVSRRKGQESIKERLVKITCKQKLGQTRMDTLGG